MEIGYVARSIWSRLYVKHSRNDISNKEFVMTVFISYSHRDNDIATKISGRLEKTGFDVFVDNKIPVGSDIYSEIGKGIAKADAVIIIVSKNTRSSYGVMNEDVLLTHPLLSFMYKGKMPLLIPLVVDKETEIPRYLRDLNCLLIPDRENLIDALDQIVAILKMHEQKLIEHENENKEAEKKVKQSLSIYISDVFTVLKKSEKSNKLVAIGLYILSVVFMVISAGFLVYRIFNYPTLSTDYFQLAYFFVSSLLAIALLVALSRLFFTLGKSFMVEAIRSADRNHAISFGKFFLDAYGNEASREEIIKAFSAWNIDGGSAFRTQSSEEYNPSIQDFIKILGRGKT